MLLRTKFVDSIVKNNVIKAIILTNKSGVFAIKAKIYIDCTGDADVSVASGVPYTLGNKKDGNMQLTSMFFCIGNSDVTRTTEYVKKIATFLKAYSMNLLIG